MDKRSGSKSGSGSGMNSYPRKNIDYNRLQNFRKLDEDKKAQVIRQAENARILEELRRKEREERTWEEYKRINGYNDQTGEKTDDPQLDIIGVSRQGDEPKADNGVNGRVRKGKPYNEDKTIKAIEEKALRQQKAKEEALRQQRVREEALMQQRMREEAMLQQRAREEALRQQRVREEALRQQKAKEEDDLRQQRAVQEALRKQRAREEAAQQQRAREEAAQQQRANEEALRRQGAQNEPERVGKATEDAFGTEKKDGEIKTKKAIAEGIKARFNFQKKKEEPENKAENKSEKTTDNKSGNKDEKKDIFNEVTPGRKGRISNGILIDKPDPYSVEEDKTEKEQKPDIKEVYPDNNTNTDDDIVILDVNDKTDTSVRIPGVSPVVLKWAAVIITVLLLIVYIAGAIFFNVRYFPKTTVNGIDSGMSSASDTEEAIKGRINGYTLTVVGRDGVTGELGSSDISLGTRFNGEVEKSIKDQKALKWPAEVFKEHDILMDEVTYYSAGGLAQAVRKMAFFDKENIKEPVNAYLSDVTDEGYKVIPEDNGSVPIEEAIIMYVSEAVDTLEPDVNIDNDSCYKNAEITSSDPELNTMADNLNRYCSAKITYVFGDKKEVLDPQKISEWVSVEDTEVTLDESKVAEYVKSFARKYDTFGQPHKFKTHSGEEITVTQGAYGWWLDRPAETEELLENIRSGFRGERSPVFKEVGMVYGENDYGDNYVEADLSSQHLWVYKDGKVATESDFVSGNITKGNGTHVGIYGITYKERDATLSGASYSSNVSYWMPFNGNEGMHDAPWRSAFGGEIYVTNGSHGCINLPPSNAAKIFDLVEEGEPIIIYGGKTYTPPAQKKTEELTPEEQLALLIESGLIAPDGTIPVPVDNVENQE